MASTFSLSNEFSKDFGNENSSMYDLYSGDAENRVIDAITTERIEKNNTILGTYKVISDPISGGMGSVWCVHHESWDADLAMKRPQPRYFAEGSDTRKEQFVDECQNWINLGLHPNIVSCYYVREIGGVPTIFSEWMDGGSLSDRIKDGSLYEGTEEEIQERILDIAIQAARGLQYSHENGLIHQDMKPGNLLLTKDLEAKVADFGLAKAKEQLDDKSDTAKTTGGTLAYCPKEQRDGEEPARWMDVYAWALTVISMYEGQKYPRKNENNDWEYPWLSGAEAKENLDEYFSKCKHNIPDEMRDLLRACINDKPDGFDDIEKDLIGIYGSTVGKEYKRKRFDSKTISADNQNNYALTMLDLGLGEAALETWDKTIAAYPGHAQSIINRAFFLWRNAQISDEQVSRTLEMLPDSESKTEAMELLSLERGDSIETEEGIISTGKSVCSSVEAAVFDTNDSILITEGYVEQPRNINQVMWNITSGRPEKTHHRLKRVNFKTDETQVLSLRETVLLTLTSDRKKAIAGSTNGLYLINLENGDQKKDITIKMTDEERYQAYPEHKDMWSPDYSVSVMGITLDDPEDAGKGVIRKIEKPKWNSVWLENNDTVLCIAETTRWEKASDVAAYQKWEKKKKGQQPKVESRLTEHILRFSLDDNLNARLLEIKAVENNCVDLVKPLLPHEGRYERALSNVGYKWYNLLVDKETGRIIKTLDAAIDDFAPDGQYYCSLGCVYRVPSEISKNRQYRLSRIKSIVTVISEVERSGQLAEAFDNAFARKDYLKAIEAFNEYREIPDKLDAERTVKMELKLSRVCVKKRLHHYAAPASDTDGFDMSVFDNGWVKISYHYEVDKDEWRTDGVQNGGIRHVPYKVAAPKILDIIRDKTPMDYRDDDGEIQVLDIGGKVIYISLMNYDMTAAFVEVYDRKEKTEVMLRVDIEDKNAEIVSTRGGTPVIASDGLTWVKYFYREHDFIRVNEDEASGYCIDVPHGISGGQFSPDSRFFLNNSSTKNSMNGYESVIGIIPESLNEQPYHVQIIDLPPCSVSVGAGRNMHYFEMFFTADGLHLTAVFFNRFRQGEYEGDYQQEAIPWLRLSWEYELPGQMDEEVRYNKYTGKAKKPIKQWDPSTKKPVKKETDGTSGGGYSQPVINIGMSNEAKKLLPSCLKGLLFYLFAGAVLLGLILNLVWAANISSVIKNGDSVTGTAVRGSDFFLSPSVTLEYAVDGEQYEIKNTMRFDSVEANGGESDDNRRQVEVFYKSDHPEKAYTRYTLSLAELRRTIFLIAFIAVQAVLIVSFIRFRRSNRKKFSGRQIIS